MSHSPYHHGDLRRAVLEASLQLISQEGLEGLTLRAVAKKLGVSHAAPVYHFATRADLLGALAEEGFRLFAEALEVASRGGTEGRLLRVGRAYLDFAWSQPQLYRVIFGSELSTQAVLSPGLQAASERSMNCLKEAAGANALLCWAVVHGLVQLRTGPYLCATEAERAGLGREVAKELERFVAMVEGIGPPFPDHSAQLC